MLHYTVFQEFVGKHVSVSTTGGTTFNGILKFDIHNGGMLIVDPVNLHTIKFYGAAYLDCVSVAAIREVKPQQIVNNNDDGDDCDNSK